MKRYFTLFLAIAMSISEIRSQNENGSESNHFNRLKTDLHNNIPVLTNWTASDCRPTDCSIVSNGNFNVYTINNNPNYIERIFNYQGVCGWGGAMGTAQINTGGANNSYASLWSWHNNGNQGEAIKQQITVNGGVSYTFRFSYRVRNDKINHIVFGLTNQSVFPQGQLGDFFSPNIADEVVPFNLTDVPADNIWHHVSIHYTPSRTFSHLIIFPYQDSPPELIKTWLDIDSVSIIPGFTVDAGNDTTFCGQSIRIGNDAIGGTPPYHYHWGPSAGLSPSDVAQPLARPHITTTYTVTVTDSLGCTVEDNIVLKKLSPVIITGHQNNCDSISYYSIVCPDNIEYTWNIFPASAGRILLNENFQVAIGWNQINFPDSAVIQVTACNSFVEHAVFQCCKKTNSIMFHDTTFHNAVLPNDVILNGTINVEGDVFFNRCNMGQNARIVVNTHSVAKIKSGRMSAYCGKMWDGIYAEDPTSRIELKGAQVMDAKNAVVLANGAQYAITDTTVFDRNYIHILIKDDSLPCLRPAGIISHTNFKCSNTLLSPYLNQNTRIGIYVKNQANIIIGDSSGFGKRNCFLPGIDTCIKIENSNVAVYNNLFEAGGLSTKCAIFSNSYNNSVNKLTVGGKNATDCKQSNCFRNFYTGIQTLNNHNLLVYGDTFVSCRTGADVFKLGTANTVIIRNNYLDSGKWRGIHVRETPKGFIYIDSNKISNQLYNCISIENTHLQPLNKLVIQRNLLSVCLNHGFSEAIVVTNVLSHYIRGNNPYISFNTITINNSEIQPTGYRGISIYGTVGALVQCNSVMMAASVPAYTSANAFRYCGIYAELSPAAYFCRNNTMDMGCGFCFSGTMPSTKLKLNKISRCFYGVKLKNANIGNQVQNGSLSNGNQWIDDFIGGVRIQGNLSVPSMWYFGSGASSILPYQASNLTSVYTNNTCVECFISDPGRSAIGITTTIMQDISQRNFVYSILNDENRFFDEYYLFNYLRKLDLNDSVWQTTSIIDFYQEMGQSEISKLSLESDANEESRPESELTSNSGNACERDYINNMIAVNNINLDSRYKDRVSFKQEEYDFLKRLAVSSPYDKGPAVYGARVLLDTSILDSEQLVNQEITSANNSSILIKPYPNPSQNILIIDCPPGFSEKITYYIYTTTGSLIKATEVSSEDGKIMIETRSLAEGSYVITIRFSSQILGKGIFNVVR